MSQDASDTQASDLKNIEIKHGIGNVLSVARLLGSQYDIDNVDAFFLQIDQCFERLEQQATVAGWRADQFQAVRYALCAFFDERLLQDGGPEVRQRLQAQSLQARYCDDYLAGQGFFDRLDAARADARQNLEVLEVYLLCLIQGFKGQYVERSPQALQSLINDLRGEIGQQHSTLSRLSPEPLKSGDYGFHLPRKTPGWVVTFLFVSTGAALCWAGNDMLSRQSQVLSGAIEQRWGSAVTIPAQVGSQG
nr:type IVB secretion system protein IcmH/DotU [uncultured Pseudomonas sp.]